MSIEEGSTRRAHRAFVVDAFFYIPIQVAPALVSLASVPILTRLVSLDQYGVYVLATAVATTAATLATSWIGNAIVRFLPVEKESDNRQKVSGAIVVLSGASQLPIFGLLAVSWFVWPSMFVHRTSLVFAAMAFFVATAATNIVRSVLVGRRLIQLNMWFTLLTAVIGPLFGLGLVASGFGGIEGMLWGSSIIAAVSSAVIWLLAEGRSLVVDADATRRFGALSLQYGLPLLFSLVAFGMLETSDRYIIALYHGGQAVAVYSASYGLASRAVAFLASLYLTASYPVAMRAFDSEGLDAAQRILPYFTRVFLLFGVPMVVGLSLLAKPVLEMLLERQYIDGYRVIPFVAFAWFLSGLSTSFQLPLSFLNRNGVLLWSTIVAALLQIGLNFVFVPRFGYLAAAVTTLLSYACFLTILATVSRRFATWKFPFAAAIRICVATTIMALSVIAWIFGAPLGRPAVVVFGGVGLGASAYLASLILLGEVTTVELRQLFIRPV